MGLPVEDSTLALVAVASFLRAGLTAASHQCLCVSSLLDQLVERAVCILCNGLANGLARHLRVNAPCAILDYLLCGFEEAVLQYKDLIRRAKQSRLTDYYSQN